MSGLPSHPRLLVVADATDRGAQSVAEVVAARHGADAVTVVTPAGLTTAATWQHRISAGRASTRITLPTGQQLHDHPASLVLNRIRWVVPPVMTSEADRGYAVMELHALLLSWLAGTAATVVNPPTPAGLAGVHRDELELLAWLSRLGLPTRTLLLSTQVRAGAGAPGSRPPPYRWSPEATGSCRALVVGAQVLDAPSGVMGLCRAVSDAVRCPLLAVDLVHEQDRGWVVAGVDALPDLTAAAQVRAVADLVDRAASCPSRPGGAAS